MPTPDATPTPTPENTPVPGGGIWRWDAEAACWVDMLAAVSPSDPSLSVAPQDAAAKPTKPSKSKE